LSPITNLIDNAGSFSHQSTAVSGLETTPRRQKNHLGDFYNSEIVEFKRSDSTHSIQSTGKGIPFIPTLSQNSSVNFKPVNDEVELMEVNILNCQNGETVAEELHATSKSVSENSPLIAKYI